MEFNKHGEISDLTWKVENDAIVKLISKIT